VGKSEFLSFPKFLVFIPAFHEEKKGRRTEERGEGEEEGIANFFFFLLSMRFLFLW